MLDALAVSTSLKSVLVIEDDPDTRDELRALLVEEGFTVIATPRGTDLHVRFTEKTVGGPTLFHVLH